jgi:DDB1- and CUL4-associated factor 11
VTGDDDAVVCLYDKRTIGSDKPILPIGKFFGHISGITSVDITDNGTYIASNGKDQCVKLWDIRKVRDQKIFDAIDNSNVIYYDYTNTSFDKSKFFFHKADNSIYTFKGHTTHYTQIQCKFSPQSWTGERFIATGSFCGCTIIYDTLTGEKLGDIAPNCKLIAKVPLWHPKNRKLICTSENKFYVYCYDPNKKVLKNCVGKKNHLRLLKRLMKVQKEEQMYVSDEEGSAELGKKISFEDK